MKKPIIRTVKTVIPSQDASVTSPIGPLLGQYGANIKDFCTKFNEFTQKYDEDLNLMVNITIFKDKTLSFDILNVVGSFMIFEEQFLFDKQKEKEKKIREKKIRQSKVYGEKISSSENNLSKLVLLENYKKIIGKNLSKFFFFFEKNSNFFFFSEFLLYFLSKKTFNDYFSELNFAYDFFICGKYFDETTTNYIFKTNVQKSVFNLENYQRFNIEVDEYLHPMRFKKKKSFFLKAGEDEDKKEEEEEEHFLNQNQREEGYSLVEKNAKYFDLEKLEEYKQREEMKKKKKPKYVSRIVKMKKFIDDSEEEDFSNNDFSVQLTEAESDKFFFYIPKTITLSVLYRIVKYKHYYNPDISEKILLRMVASTIISMDIKIIDDVF